MLNSQIRITLDNSGIWMVSFLFYYIASQVLTLKITSMFVEHSIT